MTTMRTGAYTTGAYRSYLVRFWQSNPQGDWRASAQCVRSGHIILFDTHERLLAFLHSELTVNHQADAGPEQGEPAELPR